MQTITSVQNPDIKNIVRLHKTKERAAQQLFIAEGTRVITTLLRGGIACTQLYAMEEHVRAAQQLHGNTTHVTDNVMKKISTTKTPSGLLGIFQIPAQTTDLGTGLVLANVSDPGNMGTLIRTAAALNKKTVVVVGGTDPFGPKVVQASAGTLALVNIIKLSWEELVEQKGKLQLCALVVAGGKPPRELDLYNSLLVVGNEAHGVPENWLAYCEQQLTLPMPGNTESLNAAVAGSIALYLS